MGKKFAFIVLLLLLFVIPSHAVLKEKDLSRTLAILRQELTNYHAELERQTGYMKEQRQHVVSQIISVLQQSQQNALMLYSQRDGNIFDLTYACHEATEQFMQFRTNAKPFKQYIDNINVEVNRYDSLITDLSTMYTGNLSEKSKTDRDVSLTLAVNIRRTLKDNRTQMEDYVRMYTFTETRLKDLNDYANKRYTDIQNSIFSNGGDNYFRILSDLGDELQETTQTVVAKYRPMKNVQSDWDSKVILGLLTVLVVGSLVAAAINYFLIGLLFTWMVRHNKLDFLFAWLLKRNEHRDPKEAFHLKRTYIILAATVFTFAIILGVVSLTWEQNFIIMASSLLVEYAWLTGVVLLSLLIRLDGDQIKGGFRVYLPILAICLVVISFRIILIPNDLVNLVFPPILVGCALWHWKAMSHHHRSLPKSDLLYSYVSTAVFLASIVAALVGYTLLSVEMLIWWTMQLTCILTVTCISSVLRNIGNDPRHRFLDERTPITRSWFFLFIYKVALPTLAALSVIISIYWAADVFNMSETTWRVFNMRLVDSKNLTLSIFGVVQVVVLFYVFAFINQTAIRLLKYNFWLNEKEHAEEEDRKADEQSVESRTAMWRNVVQVFVWGVWVLVSMAIFNINNSWLVAISAGLSTGIGFAMKDILENIYYGISLMAGRIRVGDYISIDGTRGTVKSISYVSTMLEAGDGSVIAFQNAQLFTKNYKNLTKNHGNELDSIVVGVAYGSNAAEVKDIIAEAVKAIERPDFIKFINVVFSGFGDNSIDFKVMCWVDSRKQTYAHGEIMEAVYNALNRHNIEIPYPQRDLHIVSDSTRPAPAPTEMGPTAGK